jgi:predicted transcriptional regulator of viral defense system
VRAGIDDDGIARRVRKGTLHRVHQGVYAVGHPKLTTHGRWAAAVLACGPGCALSRLDAAALWGFYDASGPRVHVLTASYRKVRGICTHRARRLHPDDITEHHGIPVTSVARTLVDLTDLLAPDRILRAIREAEFLKPLDHDALNAAVQRARGRRNVAVIKNALARHRPGQIVRDELEHRFLELIRATDIREPETNVEVRTRRRTYTVDCLWRPEGVAVELDGRAAHARVTAFEQDRERDAALSAMGLRPVRFTWRRITRAGEDVIADLVEMLGPRRRGPLP